MKLTALGVWGGYPTRDAGTTSYLLQSEEGFNLLLDAGSRAVTELEHELSPNDLDAIILSHYHEDHIADLGALRQYRQLQTVKPQILPIYGHQQNYLWKMSVRELLMMSKTAHLLDPLIFSS